MIKNISFYACLLFLCIALLFVGKIMHTYEYKYIIKIAINVLSAFLILACTVAIIKNINKIPYGDYVTLYLITFMTSWLCLFSNSLAKTKASFMNDINQLIPMSIFSIGSLCAMIIGFMGFPIVRAVQRVDYKVIGYLLSTFILVISAAVVWIFGLPSYALLFEKLSEAFIK